MDLKKLAILLAGPLLSLLVYFSPIPLPLQAKLVLAITILAVVYWFTEVVELHITGFLIAFLLIVLGGFTPAEIFPNYFDPVVMLLLGGFALAVALQKYSLDSLLAFKVLNKVGTNPKTVLLAFMLVTAFLSFWVSNTASAAVMIPIGLIVLKQNKLSVLKSKYAKSFLLGIAYAATIGGIGTLVGSTPNPLAAKYLNDLGQNFGFFDWAVYGMPFAIVFLFVIFFVLSFIFPSEVKKVSVQHKEKHLNKKQLSIIAIFAVTVLFWVLEPVIGISSSVVALIPVLLLFFSGLLKGSDFSKINWPILSLIGSGIVLGYAFHSSTLDLYIAELLKGFIVGQPLFFVFFAISIVGVIVTMFASNTASAAIMIPLIIPLAPILGIPVHALIIVTAIAVSLDFTAPMGTPPNAIAYSTGYLKVWEMAKSGLLLSFIASIMLSLFATFFWA